MKNIILVVADDFRADCIGAKGNIEIKTPFLDCLVRSGFSFDKTFCTTPICTPARAEILTGCQSFKNKVPWFGMPIEENLTLLPEHLRENGYHTIHVGKWHNDGHPKDRGFIETACVCNQDNLNQWAKHGHEMKFSNRAEIISGHSSEVFSDVAFDRIQKVPAGKPFFCYLAYTAPHDPHVCPEPFQSMYLEKLPGLYPNHLYEHPFDNGDMVIRDELLENWPRQQDAMRRYRGRYYGMISHLDHCIGRFHEKLRISGLLDNTIFIFTGDQGIANGSHGLLGKANMYDHSISAPLIFQGPEIPPGGRTTAMAHHVDLVPTICSLAGIVNPDTAEDGFDLMPVIRGEKSSVRDQVLCQFYSPEGPSGSLRHTQRALRTERYKLAFYPLSGGFTLFDLEHDPEETENLLAFWRLRWRWNLENMPENTYRKDAWARPVKGTELGYSNVEELFADMKRRMVDQMKRIRDPIANDERLKS